MTMFKTVFKIGKDISVTTSSHALKTSNINASKLERQLEEKGVETPQNANYLSIDYAPDFLITKDTVTSLLNSIRR